MSRKATFAILLLFTTLAVLHSYPYQGVCDCPDTLPFFPGPSNWKPSSYQAVSPTDVIVDNENWGKIVYMNGQAWLTKEAPVYPSVDYLLHNCPFDYRPPTEVELLGLLQAAAANSPDGNPATFFTSGQYNFFLNDQYAYLSSEETYPEKDNEQLSESFEFKSLTITANGDVKKAAISSVSSRDSNARVKCVSKNPLPVPSEASKILYTSESEVIQGVDNGRLAYFAKNLWLTTDLSATRGYRSIGHTCPKGFRPPTVGELTDLATAAKQANSTSPADFLTKRLGFNSNLYYVSSTKTYPGNTQCNTKEAWEFSVLSFKGNDLSVSSLVTYWYPDQLAVRCILDGAQDFTISGSSSKELIVGNSYRFSVNRSNLVSVFWSDGESVIGPASDGTSNREYNYIPKVAGCNILNVYVELFGGIVLNKCLFQWAQFAPSTNEIRNTATVVNKVEIASGVNATKNINLARGSAPASAKKLGGAYIFYSENGGNLVVKETNAAGQVVKTIPLNEQGLPFHICEVPFGFVTLFKNGDKLSMVAFNEDGSRRYALAIMNNGPNPVNGTDQIKFYGRSDGTLVYGMSAMFNPISGRIIFAKSRINVHFLHYNFFGLYQDGSRSDHYGDSFVSFDMEGKNEMVGWPWGVTYGLSQALTFDGEKVITATLGASSPMNIQVKSVNPEEVAPYLEPFTQKRRILTTKSTDTLVEGEIPYNFWYGGSCGRVGGLVAFEQSSALIYSKKKCELVLWKKLTSLVDELAVVFFGKDLLPIKKVLVVENQVVSQVKTARYGKNLLVGYSIVKTEVPISKALSDESNPADDFFLAIVNENGDIVQKGVKVPEFSLSSSDDWITLNDGRVGWTYVDAAGKLSFYTVQI